MNSAFKVVSTKNQTFFGAWSWIKGKKPPNQTKSAILLLNLLACLLFISLTSFTPFETCHSEITMNAQCHLTRGTKYIQKHFSERNSQKKKRKERGFDQTNENRVSGSKCINLSCLAVLYPLFRLWMELLFLSLIPLRLIDPPSISAHQCVIIGLLNLMLLLFLFYNKKSLGTVVFPNLLLQFYLLPCTSFVTQKQIDKKEKENMLQMFSDLI